MWLCRCVLHHFFFFKQKTAYEMRISDWNSDVCSSDLEAWEDFALREAPDCTLPEADPEDICYLQYSSGSTRFPTGVAVTHRALIHNLFCHAKIGRASCRERVCQYV